MTTLVGAAESAFSVIVTNNDRDGDGLSDVEEATHGTNPLQPDSDSDGLNDWSEVEIGTNPLNPDTDGDGLSDGIEDRVGSDPRDPSVTTGPSPELAAISPSGAVTGASVDLTIEGAGFYAGVSVVELAGQQVPTTFVSGGQLRATVPASALCPPGPCTVTVTNPAPGGGGSNVVELIVLSLGGYWTMRSRLASRASWA